MTKRVRRDPGNDKQKGDHNLEDWISQLPDEILVHILSYLTFKEAAVTSVLSSRWTYLWTHHACLDFDAKERIHEIIKKKKLEVLKTERLRFVKWVNRVVKLYRGSSIEEFRVCFDLDDSSKCDVNKWLKFALAKRLQRLELDLSGTIGSHPKNYTISHQLLDQSKGTSKKLLDKSKGTSLKILSSKCPGTHPCIFVGFNSLKAMFLKQVNVSGEVLEFFLASCPVLEQMCVHFSKDLVNLKVFGPSLVLKRLEICYCCNIKSIEIRNVNVVSLAYKGREISFFLENVPMLVELYIDGRISRSLTDVFALFACCLSQLETLTLDTYYSQEITEFEVSSKLIHLKKLVLNDSIRLDGKCLLEFTSLIKAAPYLKKLVLQIDWVYHRIGRRRKIKRKIKCVHQYLEEVEFLGYFGRTIDLEFLVYLLENAVALKKIIIDPRDTLYLHVPASPSDIKIEEAARSRAKKQLEGIVPQGIELVIV